MATAFSCAIFSRVPGADVPGAFASKLGRGEVKAWPRESLIHLPWLSLLGAPFNSNARSREG